MSYPNNLTKEELRAKMYEPVKKGTIISSGDGDGKRFKILENTIRHGCPFVIEIDRDGVETGNTFPMTLYLHSYPEREDKRRCKNCDLWTEPTCPRCQLSPWQLVPIPDTPVCSMYKLFIRIDETQEVIGSRFEILDL